MSRYVPEHRCRARFTWRAVHAISLMVALALAGVHCVRLRYGTSSEGDAAATAEAGGSSDPRADSAPEAGADGAPESGADGGSGSAADGSPESGADGAVDATTPCLAPDVRCRDSVVEHCSGGVWIEALDDCPMGCHDDGQRCRRLLPWDVAPDRLYANGAPDILVSGEVVVDTGGCRGGVFGANAPVADLVDGRCLLSMASLSVSETGRIIAQGPNPLVLLSTGPVFVAGQIRAAAQGTTPGPGGGAGSASDSPAPGECGGRIGYCPAGYDSGGGGGALGGAGGAGGVPSGAWDCTGGLGGVGVPALPLVVRGGCGGGGGLTGDGGGGGAGGAGGGVVHIVSGEQFQLAPTGVIDAGGGGGRGGGFYSGGGGGGAGGTILLEAPQMILQGMVAANGGGGGAGHVPAAVGEDGTPSTRAAAGGVCSDLTQGGPGGAGGAGNSPDGQPGPTGAFWNGGGGGGGAGRIVTRTLTGTVDVGPNSLSPNTAGTFLRQTIDID